MPTVNRFWRLLPESGAWQLLRAGDDRAGPAPRRQLERRRAISELAALSVRHEELAAKITPAGTWYAWDLEQAYRDLTADNGHQPD